MKLFLLLFFTGLATALHAQNLPSGFDYSKPLFKLQHEQLSNKNRFLRYAAITGYREGVAPVKGQFGSNFMVQIDAEAGTHQIKMYNLSIQDMLTHGLRKPAFVILEVKDPSKYHYDPSYGTKLEWQRKNTYCYELLIPKGVLKNISMVDEDLLKYFGVKCYVEKRAVKTLILVRTAQTEKFKASGDKEEIKDLKKGYYQNVSIAWIGVPLYEYGTMPFLDETGYKEPVNINLNVEFKNMNDLPALRKALQQYDLDLKEEMREMEMFIIKEIKS